MQPDKLTRIWLVLIVVGVPLLAIAFNRFSRESVASETIDRMNDVPTIIRGYEQTPRLFPDSFKWWHGPWIQYDVGALRPLASYQLWLETDIGIRWGFFYTACIGMLLLIVDGWLCAALAWRFTGSRWCALVGAALGPAVCFFNYNGLQPPDWLAWYAVHHDLLFNAFFLGGLLGWCLWLDAGERRALVATWVCFICGALTKEYGYIFPIMALLLVFRRTRESGTRKALIQLGLMAAIVAFLIIYRRAVIATPYNPNPLTTELILRKPLNYWFYPLFRYLWVNVYWIPLLGLLTFGYFGALLHWRQRLGRTLETPGGWMSAVIGFLVAACLLVVISGWLPDVLGTLASGGDAFYLCIDIAAIALSFYVLRLIWKYRRAEPSIATWLLMAVVYLPVITFDGWHYTITGWFIRAAIFWPMAAKLAYLDLWPLLCRLLAGRTRAVTASQENPA